VTVTRDYVWRLTPREDEDLAELGRRARGVLGWVCEGDKRVDCRGISGESFGFVEIGFRVKGRDLWDAGQIGQNIIDLATRRLRNPAIASVQMEPLAPHDHRGYEHGRTKRVNRPRGQSETRPGQ
jgi:hypothetical protein